MIATRSLARLCRAEISGLLKRKDMSTRDMESLLHAILSGADVPLDDEESALLAGLLVALSMKGESVRELVGAARAMRHHARRIQAIGSPVVDIVGTGGDMLDTFNISTTAAFVVAGAGLVVAKHGNRAASGRCGSADVLEACGVNLDLPPECVEEEIARLGIGFLFAQRFHPALRRVAPLRKRLGIRTLFNLLGPLANPAGAPHVLLGVCEPRWTEVFAETLRRLGCRSAMVVHGYDGMDELTVTTRSRVSRLSGGHVRTYDFFPELCFDGESADSSELRGGDAAENARILRGILSGKIRGAKRNVVLLNAGAAIYCSEKSENIRDGIRLAAEAVDSGAALEKLDRLVDLSSTFSRRISR